MTFHPSVLFSRVYSVPELMRASIAPRQIEYNVHMMFPKKAGRGEDGTRGQMLIQAMLRGGCAPIRLHSRPHSHLALQRIRAYVPASGVSASPPRSSVLPETVLFRRVRTVPKLLMPMGLSVTTELEMRAVAPVSACMP